MTTRQAAGRPQALATPDLSRPGAGAAPWPLDGRPLRSRWRGVAAVGAAVEAVAHLPVIEEHLHEAPYIGAGFILLTIAGMLLACLLLTADTGRVWLAAGIVAALALAGYLLSRSVGLPQIRDDIGDWTEPLGLLAISGEALLLGCALAVAADRARHVGR